MMRSMYSGVSGLKSHQTKMDVIGNNIANVNTVAFKSSTVTFGDVMYQTTQSASGANAQNGTGGINAKQIGLGVTMSATKTNITSAGATQSTGSALDVKLNGDSFFIVSDGTNNYFTRAGSFTFDGVGNLVMNSTGYTVMGWGLDEDGNILRDNVQPLRVMNAANQSSAPEATTNGTCSGILDKNAPQVSTDEGYTMSLNLYDALGYSYVAKFSVKETDVDGEYTVELVDVLNSNNQSIKDQYNATELSDLVKFGTTNTATKKVQKDLLTGVKYDSTNKIYYKDLTLDALITDVADSTDYETDRIAGATYSIKSYTNTSIATQGKIQITEDILTDYGIVKDTAGDYYVSDGSGTLLKIDVTNNTAPGTAALLNTLKLSGNTNVSNIVCAEADGVITVTFDQSFDAKKDSAGTNSLIDATQNRLIVSQLDAYGLTEEAGVNYTYEVVDANTGTALITSSKTTSSNILKFDTDTGLFKDIAGGDTVTLDFATSFIDRTGEEISLQNFSDISVDFTQTLLYNNGGTSTMGLEKGAADGTTGTGKKLGALTGVSIDTNGMIYGSYDNGNTVVLGQIAVASFANPEGLELIGNNCYQTTLNSGEFDGIGQDVTADGGSMTTGALEMSNVDLSSEFTEMITTQRGFQANSRVITTSDTLLEELINLKR